MKQDAYQEACLHEGICSLQKTPQNNPILKCLDRFKQPASSSAGSSSEGKKNCSLTMLSKLLIMCFLVTEVTEMTQDQLMNIILKDSTEKSKYCNDRHIDILSAKTRRLNDIVNILSALHLLEKKNEKSVNSFKWLGDKIMQSTSSNTAFTTVINHNLSNKILASSLFPSITSNPNIFSPSKMPLKKRKRVKISGNGSPTGDETSPLSADSSNSPFSSQLPDTQHLPPISTTSNSPLFHTCATPTSSSSTGGLHFQFRSPPSKKNKPTPASATASLNKPAIPPSSLHDIFNFKEDVSPEIVKKTTTPSPPIQSLNGSSVSTCPSSATNSTRASPFVTTLGTFRFGSVSTSTINSNINAQVISPSMPRKTGSVPLSTLRDTINCQENNKENISTNTSLVNQIVKKPQQLTTNPSPLSVQSTKANITFKIRQPLMPKQ